MGLIKLSLKDKKLNELPEVKKWLKECEDKLEEILDLESAYRSVFGYVIKNGGADENQTTKNNRNTKS